MLIRRAYLGMPCWLAMTMGMSVADASDYPARPVRFVVAQPPGGGTDVHIKHSSTTMVRESRKSPHGELVCHE